MDKRAKMHRSPSDRGSDLGGAPFGLSGLAIVLSVCLALEGQARELLSAGMATRLNAQTGAIAGLRTAGGAVRVSGTDAQVQRTTICADSTGQRVVVFWESRQFAAHEHIRLNRSANGGQRWRAEPLDFPLNVVNPWFSDYLPEVALDESGALHVLWSQRNDTSSPGYARSTDLGDTWTKKTTLGGGHLPRWCGLTLVVGGAGTNLWAFYHDFNWHAYACGSSDGGGSWVVLADHNGAHSAGDPAQGYCSDAVAYGERRHVLRRRGGVLEVLTCDGGNWSACAPLIEAESLTLAADHTIAADSRGRLFVVCGSGGRVRCLRSDDAGASFGLQTLVTPDQQGEQAVPVIALLPGAGLAVAWQQTVGETSQIWCAVSEDGGQTFGESRPVSPGDGPQTAPDLCAVGETLYFSFTERGQAMFSRAPELPTMVDATGDRTNLFPDPRFEDFDGSAPRGWTVTSWNQEFLRERFGKGAPGRDGTGACLEMQAGSGASIIQFRGPPIDVEGDLAYFLKGYYASTCEKVSVEGTWLDDAGKTLRTFEVRLPDTQDGWVHFIRELSGPVFARQLRFSIVKKWQSGRARLDDVSLRRGTVADYASEFDLPAPASDEPWFPIFSWLGPFSWSQLGPEMARQLDRDEYHLDYVLANFTAGYRAKFGLRYHPGPPADGAAIRALDRDPAVWVYSGGDEPSQEQFAGIAERRQALRDAGATKPLWCNLLPTYGFKSYEAYDHHVRAYLETVKTPFFTYDHYCLSKGNRSYGRDFFGNLEIVRRQALDHGAEWGAILQLVAFGGMRSPDEAELRWQAFSALAYGAKAIGWFTYLTEVEYGGMNWHDAAVDREGFRTRHYAMLVRVNGELRQIGRTLVGLRSTGVYHTAPLPELTTAVSKARLAGSVEGGPLVIGELADGQGNAYIMLVSRDFTAPVTASVVLKHPATAVVEISKTTGAAVPVEGYEADRQTLTVSLAPGDGRLLRLRK